MSRTIYYDGKVVSFREFKDGAGFVVARLSHSEKDVCPLCKKVFAEHPITSVVLVISNQAGIPNRFVHSECLADKTDEYAFGLIAEDYQEALKYEDWFR